MTSVHCARLGLGTFISRMNLYSQVNYCIVSSSSCWNHIHKQRFSISLPCSKKFDVKNNDEFMQKVLNNSVPVIVNFHAEWCDPCKILTPKLEELLGPIDNVDLAIVDVENNAELVHTFEVKAVPAVIAMKNGLIVDKFIGLVDGTAIEDFVKKLAAETKKS